MKNIYLVGFMGTGKTYVGRILASRLKRTFIEMDETIEARQVKKIADIFAEFGEKHFRDLEHELLIELAEKQDLVVSCGGGLICHENNLKLLKSSGVMINLESSPEKIYERIKGNTQRPLLNVPNPLEKIRELFAERKVYYDQADLSVRSENETPEQVADNILEIIKSKLTKE